MGFGFGIKPCPAAALPAGIPISHHLQLSIIILLLHRLALLDSLWGHKLPWQGPSGPNGAHGGWGVSGGMVAARGQHRPWEGVGPGLFSAPPETRGRRTRDAADPTSCLMGKSRPRATPLRRLAAHRPLLLLAGTACSPARRLGWWGFSRGPPVPPGCRGAGSVPRGLEGREEPRCLGDVAVG